MKEILLNLIRERTSKVSLALELLKEKFGDINFIAAKNGGQIPKTGFLDAAQTVSYNLHGKGCDVDFGGERIEFDFNFATRNHSGFDRWRLNAFLRRHRAEYKELADLSAEDLQVLLVELERENRIVFDETANLFFLPDGANIKAEPKVSEMELVY
jgi:hypothetical protein